MEIRAIKTKKQYRTYLDEVDHLMNLDPHPDSPEGTLLETLVILIEEYESRLGLDFPDVNDPIFIIKKRMEHLNLKQKDLVPVIGDKTVVSRVLKGERKLNYEMLIPLSEILKIPVELLLKQEVVETEKV